MMIDAKMHHIGLWVQPADCDALLKFLRDLLGFKKVSQVQRKTGGDRIFLKNGEDQKLEILTADNVRRLDEYPRHPKDRVAGVAHLCFSVADSSAVAARAEALGAEVILRAPADGSFVESELGEHRIVFVQAPGEITIELFQFNKQVSL
jgi:catechol 2,3-dioxygenase-like lactoylglutathione lyase family enzyme